MTASRIRPDDPTAVLGAVEAATGRLLQTAVDIRPDQIGDPSLLPGWTRGHVLAHVSRSAEAMLRMMEGARENRQAGMYPSAEARERDIEDGAARGPEDQAADLKDTADRIAEVIRDFPAQAWSFELKHRSGLVFPAGRVPWLRLAEVEYHHVDLDLGYGPGDWPTEFVEVETRKLTERFAADEELPPVLLRDTATDRHRVPHRRRRGPRGDRPGPGGRTPRVALGPRRRRPPHRAPRRHPGRRPRRRAAGAARDALSPARR
ncbi:hypothetical protein GCM10027570_03030 [Streptomonospora sediminis]